MEEVAAKHPQRAKWLVSENTGEEHEALVSWDGTSGNEERGRVRSSLPTTDGNAAIYNGGAAGGGHSEVPLRFSLFSRLRTMSLLRRLVLLHADPSSPCGQRFHLQPFVFSIAAVSLCGGGSCSGSCRPGPSAGYRRNPLRYRVPGRLSFADAIRSYRRTGRRPRAPLGRIFFEASTQGDARRHSR